MSNANETTETWQSEPLAALIEYILSRFHEPLRSELPALVRAARAVEEKHGGKEGCPTGLAAQLEQTQAELFDHLLKEEHVLFRAIAAGHRGMVVQMPIHIMMKEHEGHTASMKWIRELTSDLQPPADACATWRELYAGLTRLEADLEEHIALENEILFRRALNESA